MLRMSELLKALEFKQATGDVDHSFSPRWHENQRGPEHTFSPSWHTDQARHSLQQTLSQERPLSESAASDPYEPVFDENGDLVRYQRKENIPTEGPTVGPFEMRIDENDFVTFHPKNQQE